MPRGAGHILPTPSPPAPQATARQLGAKIPVLPLVLSRGGGFACVRNGPVLLHCKDGLAVERANGLLGLTVAPSATARRPFGSPGCPPWKEAGRKDSAEGLEAGRSTRSARSPSYTTRSWAQNRATATRLGAEGQTLAPAQPDSQRWELGRRW